MPSTSSMMSTWGFGEPSKFTALLVTISFTTLAVLPFIPVLVSFSDLPRASLAFTSITS
jgi:hypothetical protein